MLALRPWMLPAVLTRRSTIRLHEWVGSLPGVGYDFTSALNLWQDAAGSTPVTTSGQSIRRARDMARLSGGNDLLALSDIRRPTWGAMANGLPCSVWDGTRAMATAAAVDFSSTDQITVMAAVRSLDNSDQIIAELSAVASVTNGSFALRRTATSLYQVVSRGTAAVFPSAGSYPQPDNAILVMRARISTDYLELIRNGTQIATSASDQGTGNYSGTQVLNIGARNAASPSLFFNGQIARLLAIGGNPTAEQYAAWLAWTAQGFATS